MNRKPKLNKQGFPDVVVKISGIKLENYILSSIILEMGFPVCSLNFLSLFKVATAKVR